MPEAGGKCNRCRKQWLVQKQQYNPRRLISRTRPTSASQAPLPEGFTQSAASRIQHAECEAVTGIPNSNLTVQPTASGIGDLSGSVVAVMGPVREATSGLQLEARWRRLDWN